MGSNYFQFLYNHVWVHLWSSLEYLLPHSCTKVLEGQEKPHERSKWVFELSEEKPLEDSCWGNHQHPGGTRKNLMSTASWVFGAECRKTIREQSVEKSLYIVLDDCTLHLICQQIVPLSWRITQPLANHALVAVNHISLWQSALGHSLLPWWTGCFVVMNRPTFGWCHVACTMGSIHKISFAMWNGSPHPSNPLHMMDQK